MKQTIYQYVNSHLDEHGRFTATNLCDDRYATIPRPLGSEDAFHYTMGNLPNPKSASVLLKLLQAYLKEPTTQQRSKLYNELRGMAFAEYCDPFIEALDQNDINSVAFDLARRFSTTPTDASRLNSPCCFSACTAWKNLSAGARAVAGFTAHSALRRIYLRLFIFLPRNKFQPAKRYLGAYPLYQRLGQGFQHYRLPLP